MNNVSTDRDELDLQWERAKRDEEADEAEADADDDVEFFNARDSR